ncbi:ATP-binding protein [Candidatus Woesearchaeota archaeon]|nr:ATP-binding protein [Candidatus Woesearchaeota archaeon]
MSLPKKEITDVVEFSKAKETLESYVQEWRTQLSQGASLQGPVVHQENTNIQASYRFDSSHLDEKQVLQLVDHFLENYSKRNTAVTKMMDTYLLTQISHIANLEVHMLAFGIKYQQTSKESSITFCLSVSDGFTNKDLQFLKNAGTKLLPPPVEQFPVVTLETLTEMGLQVENDLSQYTWNSLAGYQKTKEDIFRKILKPNFHKEEFLELRQHTRKIPQQVGYNCFLFSGTYGVGKTEMAKVVAAQLGYPLVALSLEAFMTKWYGEAEKQLGNIFKTIREVGKTILFIDEIDCLTGDRDGQMHESTKRLLSILMTETAKTKVGDDLIIIGATNKPDSLDGAIKRRFQKEVKFPLPDHDDLKEIYTHYAKHLSPENIEELAQQSEGFSPFDVLLVCETAEDFFIEKLRQDAEKVDPENKRDIQKTNLPLLPDKSYYLQGLASLGKKKKEPMGFKK